MATSQDFACYICGPRILNACLAHLFRGMEVEWERLMAGSTHNTIYMPPEPRHVCRRPVFVSYAATSRASSAA